MFQRNIDFIDKMNNNGGGLNGYKYMQEPECKFEKEKELEKK
jgi:hypothetical protein